MNLVWAAPPVKGGDLLVLLALADNADERGTAFPYMETVARKAAMTVRGVQKCVANLEALGLLRVERQPGRQKRNVFHIDISRLGESSDHKKGEQSSPFVEPEKGEQRDVKGEQRDEKTRTPVHPQHEEPLEPPTRVTGAREAAAPSPHSPAAPAEPDVAVTLRSLRAIWPVDRARAPKRAEKALREAVAAGVSQSTILAEARTYIEAEKDRERFRFVKPLHAWIDALPGAHVPSPPVSAEAADGVLRMFAERINQGAFVSPSALTSAKARRIVELGLVPEATMHQQGFL